MAKARDSTCNAIWDRDLLMVYCDLCIKEVEEGNRPTTFFNKTGWNNLTSKFAETTGKDYSKFQLKNKWDGLKKDWKLWKEFKKGATGLGWDHKRKTIDASEEWWKEKLEVIPSAKKFKFAGIDPELEEKLDSMFEGVVATGSFSYNPSTAGFTSLNTKDKNDVIDDSQNISDESDHNVDVNAESSRCKRAFANSPRQSNSKKGGTVMLASEVGRLANVVGVMNQSRPPVECSYSVRDVVQILEKMPEVKGERALYMNSVRIMERPIVRELFMSVDPESRLIFLRDYYERP